MGVEEISKLSSPAPPDFDGDVVAAGFRESFISPTRCRGFALSTRKHHRARLQRCPTHAAGTRGPVFRDDAVAEKNLRYVGIAGKTPSPADGDNYVESLSLASRRECRQRYHVGSVGIEASNLLLEACPETSASSDPIITTHPVEPRRSPAISIFPCLAGTSMSIRRP